MNLRAKLIRAITNKQVFRQIEHKSEKEAKAYNLAIKDSLEIIKELVPPPQEED